MMATLVLNNISYKLVLSGSVLFNGIGLYLFSESTDYTVLCFARFLSGFFQPFVTIFMPLFVDTFATHKSKSMWMSLMMLSPPLGVILGYIIVASMLESYGWRTSFLVQAILSFVSSGFIIAIPG